MIESMSLNEEAMQHLFISALCKQTCATLASINQFSGCRVCFGKVEVERKM